MKTTKTTSKPSGTLYAYPLDGDTLIAREDNVIAAIICPKAQARLAFAIDAAIRAELEKLNS